MRKIKIGIIGYGVISHTYIKDIKRLYRNIIVEAVAGPSLEKAEKCADMYDIPRTLTIEEMLLDPEIEMVVNLTPPAAHTEINRRVLEAGKHLFCEKPFALTVEDAGMIADLAEKKGLKIGCAPDSFMGSSLKTCKKLLKDKWIGQPLYVCMNMMNCGVETWHPAPENFYLEGGGPVLDMGAYYFTALVTMFGAVDSVYAAAGMGFSERVIYTPERFGDSFPVKVPTHYAVIVTMKNGMIVNANFSFDIWKTEMPMFEIYGTEGTLMVPDPNMHGGTPRVYRKEQKLAENFGGTDNGNGEAFRIPELSQNIGSYVRCLGVADLADAVINDRRPVVNSDLGVHVTEILTGIIKSAETKTVYKLVTDYKEQDTQEKT